MKNWKTTLAGALGAALIVALELYQKGTLDVNTILISAAIAAVGFLAKDMNVTGGTVEQ